MRKLKVIILVPDMAGGIASLFRQLRSVDGAAAATDIVYFASHDERPMAPARFPARLMRFASILGRDRYDLCHINVSIRGSTLRKLVFAWLCRLRGLPYAIHLHGGRYPEFLAGLPAPARAVVGDFFRHAARVVVLGAVWRDFVVAALGVDPAKVAILPNAVLGPEEVPARDESARPRLLFLGRLGAGKGIPELLAALARPEMQALDWSATLAGDGDVAGFQAQARELGLAACVAFPGWVDAEEARRLLAAAHILVLPSHAENLPLSLLEGMAWGLCPVATPVGAVPDVVRDGENGIIVPVGDAAALAGALADLIRHPDRRKRLAARAREDFLAAYDIGAYRARLEAVYRDALGG